MWPMFLQNLDLLGRKLETCLNQLVLGNDVIVEDSDLMIEQLAEIAKQIAQANHVMKGT